MDPKPAFELQQDRGGPEITIGHASSSSSSAAAAFIENATLHDGIASYRFDID